MNEPHTKVFESASRDARFDPDALTRALRMAGAALVMASASTFMLQRWSSGDDLLKYTMLVGQSLILAAAAYFVGLSMREGRSARTFLGLVLATMPICFTVLGALLYSRFHLEPLRSLPQYASWIAPSNVAALLAAAATVAVLVPLGLVSFVALARKEARSLSVAFFASNSLLLLPVRHPLVMAGVTALALLPLLQLELSRFSAKAQLDTLEGRIARVVPFLPPVLLIGRTFHLYHPGAAFAGALLLIGAATLWLVLPRVTNLIARDAGAWLVMICGVGGWSLCSVELLQSGVSAAMRVVGWGCPSAVLIAAGAVRAVRSRRIGFGLSTAVGLATALLGCGLSTSTIPALCCIVMGVAVAVWGAASASAVRILAGSLTGIAGVGVEVWLAVHQDDLLRWVSLSAVGVLLIVGSAYVERNRSRMVRFWEESSARRLADERSAAAGEAAECA